MAAIAHEYVCADALRTSQAVCPRYLLLSQSFIILYYPLKKCAKRFGL